MGGVSGSGKTTVGRALAKDLGWEFRDADHFHPAQNVAKMAAGTPLNDDDRWPWLEKLRLLLDQANESRQPLILACSALRRSYIQFLTQKRPFVRLAVLRVSRQKLLQRLKRRKGHFFPPELLESQLETQELPAPEHIFDGDRPPAEIVQEIRTRFGLKEHPVSESSPSQD